MTAYVRKIWSLYRDMKTVWNLYTEAVNRL
jgi:hypothetical protein